MTPAMNGAVGAHGAIGKTTMLHQMMQLRLKLERDTITIIMSAQTVAHICMDTGCRVILGPEAAV